MYKAIILAILFVVVLSCNNATSNNANKYIYLSHTRIDANDGVYNKVYDIDFSKYKMTLLGGDLALNSFANPEITAHLDSLFNFKSPTTLWSIGNHDKTSLKKFYQYTGKQKYNAFQRDDITFISLDSQDSLSSIVGKQKRFLFSVLDSLETKSVVLMSHKLIFMNNHPLLDSKIKDVCNGRKGDCYHCHNVNNFQEEIYPKLLQLKNKGKQVIWIGGDLGYRTSEFEYKDDAGIVFLGNGLWYKKDWNKVLIFSKPEYAPLEYEFVHIDSLLNK